MKHLKTLLAMTALTVAISACNKKEEAAPAPAAAAPAPAAAEAPAAAPAPAADAAAPAHQQQASGQSYRQAPGGSPQPRHETLLRPVRECLDLDGAALPRLGAVRRRPSHCPPLT